MESQVFRWLCVNVFEMWVWLSGASAFFVFERPVGALHAELAVEGEQRRVALQRTYLFIISPLAACLLLKTSVSSAPFFFALFPLSLPVLAYCLAHRWSVLSL